MTNSSRRDASSSSRNYDGWIICGYAVFSAAMLAAIYFALPPDAVDAGVSFAMALP